MAFGEVVDGFEQVFGYGDIDTNRPAGNVEAD